MDPQPMTQLAGVAAVRLLLRSPHRLDHDNFPTTVFPEHVQEPGVHAAHFQHRQGRNKDTQCDDAEHGSFIRNWSGQLRGKRPVDPADYFVLTISNNESAASRRQDSRE